MNRGIRFKLTLGLLLITMHRLPAPISEIPAPTPATRLKSRTVDKTPVRKMATMAEQEVQVVLSPSTQAALKYLDRKVLFVKVSGVEPSEVIERLRQVLSSRFRSVSIANDSAPQRTSGLVMVFELQAYVAMNSGKKNTVAFLATFRDSDGKLLNTITASGSSTVPDSAQINFPDALAAAFAEFSQKLGSGNR